MHETKTDMQFLQIKESKEERRNDEYYKATFDTCFIKMDKRGTKKYGKRVVVTTLNEYKQLHNLDVFGPQDAKIMSCQEKYIALRYVNLIKEKRCGKIKGRTCTDGSHRRTYIPR